MRYIGIRYRIKQTAKKEARPTQVAILDEQGKVRRYDLETEQAEYDWLRGRYPTKYRVSQAGEDISLIPQHQIIWKRAKAGVNLEEHISRQNPETKKTDVQIARIPIEWDGYQAEDQVGLVLSGSANPLAYALSRRGERIGAAAYRLNSKTLSEHRSAKLGLDNQPTPLTDKTSKDDDSLIVAELLRDNMDLFYPVTPRERDMIDLVEKYRSRQIIQHERIKCEQRIRHNMKNRLYLDPDGDYPERELEVLYGEHRANNKIFKAHSDEEKAREKELAAAIKKYDVYQVLFKNLTGVGVMIATRILVAVKDVRLFATKHKLKAYLGAHVMRGGKYGDRPRSVQFPRRRKGAHANWHADGRQGLYLLAEQCNRRPGSHWGQRLLANKAHFRAVHPEPIEVEEAVVRFDNGQPVVTKKSRVRTLWTNGHVHNSAKWRTITQFVETLWRDWTYLEKCIQEGIPVNDLAYEWMMPPQPDAGSGEFTLVEDPGAEESEIKDESVA
ncbi:MAG: hypothetical protein Q8P33_01315 [bacterium]|nr:hypothetical protein [bacterium]